jgi:hypothetical protein
MDRRKFLLDPNLYSKTCSLCEKMKNQIETLLLDANGLTWKAILADTILHGFFRLPSGYASSTFLPYSLPGKLLGVRNESLSYVLDWREALCEAAELNVKLCNTSNLVEYFHYLRRIGHYSLIIILHSATGDRMSTLLKTAEWLKKRRGKLVVFIGNEYNLLADKIHFIRSVEADYVCSQLPSDAARWLYADCTRSRILAIPHALNPKLYFPDGCSDRTIDIGFIGHLYHTLTGDLERTNLVQFFQRNWRGIGITCDIRTRRLPREKWAQFLRTCRGILGAESGTYYLDRTGRIIEDVGKYVKRHPRVSFEEIYSLFFKNHRCPVSGKAISSRHFEPIGTKTCQILIEGDYNGILKPDEHYISVKKDLSNIEDVIRRFKDGSYRRAMVERTYEYVMDGHTYRHRVDTLLRTIWDNLG